MISICIRENNGREGEHESKWGKSQIRQRRVGPGKGFLEARIPAGCLLAREADLTSERSPVVLIAAISSQKTERIYPVEAPIEPPDGGLTIRSEVMLVHLRSVAKEHLGGRYGRGSCSAPRKRSRWRPA